MSRELWSVAQHRVDDSIHIKASVVLLIPGKKSLDKECHISLRSDARWPVS